MKMRSAIFLLLASVSILRAQQATSAIEPAPLPSGELLRRAPDPSQWTVVSKASSTKANVKLSESSNNPREVEKSGSRQLTVTKSGDLRRVVGTNRDGVTAETWLRGTLQVTILPGSKTPLISDTHDGLDPYYTQFVSADFPGLQWVSAQNFAGLMKAGTQTWMVFRAKVPMDGPKEADHTPVDTVAYIDLDTRLPAYMKKGEEESLYQFAAPPDEPLVLPPTVAEAINARAQRIQQLTRMPARPY